MQTENAKPSAVSTDVTAGALEEYLAAAAIGNAPPREEFLARHPELAEDLDDCLAALRLIVHAARGPLSAIDGGDALPQVGSDSEPASRVLGDFRIVREVGRGGMGVVYEAEQISLGRRVALKVLPFAATMDQRQLQRFNNEARAAASLDHPHIVHVHAVGCERAVHFYAMQFIDGQTLAALIADLRHAGGKPAQPEAEATTTHVPSQPAPPSAETAPRAAISTERGRQDRAHFQRMAEWGIQAAEALDHAHNLGIVHRDVKPANLLVDARGSLWVTDFGLAHIQSDSRLTMTGDLIGTLRYMSPEQALAKRVVVDHRTDVYSLGATLYELLTLELVFCGADRQELLRQIAFEEPRTPRRLNKAIPAELETIVLKALEKNPAERYATAKELADDLRRFLADEPIKARPAGVVRRLRKWGSRHTPVVWAAALVLAIAALSAGGTAVVWANQRAAVQAAVGTALGQADTFQEQGKWPEALAAARHAEALLDAGPAGQGLRDRVRRRRADLEMVARVEEIRMMSPPVKDPKSSPEDLAYDVAVRDQTFETAFREYGVDVMALAPADAGARIRESSVPLALAAALDDWALVCRATRKSGDTTWKKLLAVARAADPDEWRNKVRDALEANRFDREALKRLASSEGAAEQPPSTLVRIAVALRSSGAVEEAASLLRAAQRRYPADFWVNKRLAEACGDDRYAKKNDQVRFSTVAWVLRPESLSATHDLAVALQYNGALDESILVWKQAIRLNPDWPELHDNLGIVYHRKGSYDEAIAAYREAIRRRPEFAVAWANLGVALANTRELDEAIAACREAIRLEPKGSRLYLCLSIALRRKGELDEAISACQKAVQLQPKSARPHDELGDAYYDKRQWDDAIFAYRKAIALAPKYLPPRIGLGDALESKGQLDDAIAEYRKAKALDPRAARPHNSLGIALAKKGRLDDAIAEFRQAIALDPKGAFHQNLGKALQSKGQLEDAIAEYRMAIALEPKNALPYNGLGTALAANGQLEDAIAEYRKAIALDPKSAQIHDHLGNAFYKKRLLDDAIAEYRKAIALDASDAQPHNRLGIALGAKGQLDDAIAEYRKAIALDPKYAPARNNLVNTLYNLANTLGDKGQLDEAIAQYRDVIRLKSDHLEAHCNLANTLTVKGRTDEAIAEYQEALRLNEAFPAAHCNLGQVLRGKGLFAEALVHARRGHELGSKKPLWLYPSARWVKECERLVELDGKLPAILSGQQEPANATERSEYAQVCYFKRLYAAAARLYREALATQPALGENLSTSNCYDAACAAALAGCGQGKDADTLDDKERRRLRKKALDWLRADLNAWSKLLNNDAAKNGPVIVQKMQHWLSDPDFNGLRGQESLAKLPESEHAEWQKLWATVAATLASAQEKDLPMKTKTASQPRPPNK